LTKEQCSIRIEELLAEGYNPNRLQAIPDAWITTRFPAHIARGLQIWNASI
jgi:hypothetical protein